MDEGGDTNVDVCSLTSKELRKFKKHQRKLERRALIKPTPNVNASRSSQVSEKKIEMDKQFYYFICIIMVLICSFNCNGLKNVNNFQNFVSVLYDKRTSFALLQETFWDKSYVDVIKNMYEGKIYECNGYNSRQGVAIMVANSVKDKTKLVYKDDEGRFIHVSYETGGQIFNFVSVYAPNNCIERARYFKFVNSYIENLQNVIIGGDFNTTLSNLDKGGKSKHSIDEAYRELNKTICNCNIYDVWRARNEC
ncbi:unnamed protein product [Mytilus coruscus]|uniref:Endonuclease/exonuclease/phosphatase domain-containing protein n=1 Tax=Mytilus coruscus TaxID=42192 RepID=A0A6J8ESG9_MYTCO|nr:unnamed protein product [Mytilus coruscus]